MRRMSAEMIRSGGAFPLTWWSGLRLQSFPLWQTSAWATAMGSIRTDSWSVCWTGTTGACRIFCPPTVISLRTARGTLLRRIWTWETLTMEATAWFCAETWRRIRNPWSSFTAPILTHRSRWSLPRRQRWEAPRWRWMRCLPWTTAPKSFWKEIRR